MQQVNRDTWLQWHCPQEAFFFPRSKGKQLANISGSEQPGCSGLPWELPAHSMSHMEREPSAAREAHSHLCQAAAMESLFPHPLVILINLFPWHAEWFSPYYFVFFKRLPVWTGFVFPPQQWVSPCAGLTLCLISKPAEQLPPGQVLQVARGGR